MIIFQSFILFIIATTKVAIYPLPTNIMLDALSTFSHQPSSLGSLEFRGIRTKDTLCKNILLLNLETTFRSSYEC